MTSAHIAASHRVACWTTNVHHALLKAFTNWSLPSTSSTLPWLGCPGHSLPIVQRNDTRLDVFAATVISHPHLMPHAGRPCVTVLEKVVNQLDKKKSFRGWWKFAIFPFASSRIIRNMLVTIMVKNQMFLARGGVDNASGLWMKVKLSVALKPFYIFNNKQTNRTANMDLGHSSCEFLSAGTSGLLWPRPIPNIQFTPTSTSLPYRCEIWLLSERYLCGNQQY